MNSNGIQHRARPSSRAEVPISTLVGNGPVETWLTLQDVKKGSLNVCLQYFTLTTQKSALDIVNNLLCSFSYLVMR